MQHANLSISKELHGYYARPSGTGPFPGIVVFMEAYGLKPHIRQVCDRFAQFGIAALAPDIYHGDVFEYTDTDAALNKVRGLDDKHVMDETAATLTWLDAQPDVDGTRLGVAGFCMGGRLAFLAAARHAGRLQAAVCFYGAGIAPEGEDRFGRAPPISAAGAIEAAVFLVYGARDKSITAAEHARIARTLTETGKRYTLAVYPHAGHAFMCEERPAYVPDAAYRA